MNKEQLAEQYAQSKTYGMGVYNSDIAKEDFLAGYDAAIRELRSKSDLYSNSQAFRVGYAQALKEFGWRKVEDELPPLRKDDPIQIESVDCLVKIKGEREYRQATYFYSGYQSWLDSNDNETDIHNVTHWMPIPSIND